MTAEVALVRYEGMLIKVSRKIVGTYGLDFDDVLQEARIVLLAAVDSFDSQKASFSTYLHHSLRKINDRFPAVRREKRFRQFVSLRASMENRSLDRAEENPAEVVTSVAFEFLKDALSTDAREILDWLLSNDWATESSYAPGLPSIRYTTFRFGARLRWAAYRTITAWEELRSWWTICSAELAG